MTKFYIKQSIYLKPDKKVYISIMDNFLSGGSIVNQIYREMIEDSPMGYMYIKVINDNSGRYIGIKVKDFNKSYERFFGIYDEDTISKYILNCMLRQEKLEWEKIFIEANESEKYTKKYM